MPALYESAPQWEGLSRAGPAVIQTRFSLAAATARIGEDLALISSAPAARLAAPHPEGRC